MSEENKGNDFYKFDFPILAGIIATVIMAIGLSYWVNRLEQWSNNITLIVEIAFGMVIALIVFRSTKKSEKNHETILEEIKTIVKNENELLQNHRTYFGQSFSDLSTTLMMSLETVSSSSLFPQSGIVVLDIYSKNVNQLIDKHTQIISKEEAHELNILLSLVSEMINHLKMYSLENRPEKFEKTKSVLFNQTIKIKSLFFSLS